MPYKAKGKCVYKKDTGKKVGCTKGSVKKYLAALHANVKDSKENELKFDDFFLLEKDLERQNRNEILLEVSQKYIDKINEVKRELPFKDLFGDNLRIIIPVGGTGTYNELVDEIKKIPNFSSLDTDKKEVVRKIKTKTPQGEGEKEQRISLGKAITALKISPEKKKEFLNWFSEYSTNLKSMEDLSEYSIILSRSPIDVLRMSDMGTIQSCHSQGGSYFHCAIQEAKNGGPIAYLVKSKDVKGLSKDQLNEEEIFSDKDRGIQGITPLSRIRLRRYVMDDGRELAIPEIRKYGKSISGFYDTVKNFIKAKQNIPYEDIQANYAKRKITRTGGTYSDSSDASLFNTMYDVNVFYRDLPMEDADEEDEITSRADQFEEELAFYHQQYASTLKHGSASYDVQDDEFVYYYAYATFSIDLGDVEVSDDLKDTDIDSDYINSVYSYSKRPVIDNTSYYYKRDPQLFTKVSKFFNFLKKQASSYKYSDIADIFGGMRVTDDKKLLIFLCVGEECSGTFENTDDYENILQTLQDMDDKYDAIRSVIIKSLILSRLVKDTNLTYTQIKKESPFSDIKNFEYDEDSNEFIFTSKTLPNKAIDIQSTEKLVVDSFKNILNNFIDKNFKYEKQEDKQLKFKDMFESVTITNFNGLSLYLSFSYNHFNLSIEPENLDDKTIALIKFLDNSAGDIVNIMNLCIANHNNISNLSNEYVDKLTKLYGKFAG